MAPFQQVVFHGTEGILTLGAPFNAGVYGMAELSLQDGRQVVTRERFPAANHYVAQVEAFNASLREGRPYPCPLEFSRGTQAMIIGFLLVVVFMLIYYRAAGLVANLALMFNLVLVLTLLVIFRNTLTFPGMAGLLLTVGMAVDANILIFERIREEMLLGPVDGRS